MLELLADDDEPLAESSVESRSTEIRFGGGVTEAAYRYDSSVGGFVPAGQE